MILRADDAHRRYICIAGCILKVQFTKNIYGGLITEEMEPYVINTFCNKDHLVIMKFQLQLIVI